MTKARAFCGTSGPGDLIACSPIGGFGLGVSGRSRWLALVLLRVHPLVWGLAVGIAIYLWLRLTATAYLSGGLCVDCWVSAVDGNDVLGAVGAAGTSVGTKAAKDFIEGKAKKTPFFSWLDMYDIASKDTSEGQAEEAWKKYKSLIMTEHAREGSAGDEINKAIDRFFSFSKGDISVGGDDDKP